MAATPTHRPTPLLKTLRPNYAVDLTNRYRVNSIMSSAKKGPILSIQVSANSSKSGPEKERRDESDSLTLDGVRNSLIRHEDSIIFSLLERAQTDIMLALSKRIHHGKFVAECKFQASPDVYEPAIRAQVNYGDKGKMMDMLNYPEVEETITKRVEMKTRAYDHEVNVYIGEDKSNPDPVYKIKTSSMVTDLTGIGLCH